MYSNHPATDQAMRKARQMDLSLDEALILQSAHTDILAAAVRGDIDLLQMAREELTSRGLDADGRWVGFPKVIAAAV